MTIDKTKAKALLDKTKTFDGILLTKHDTAGDRRLDLAGLKRKLDAIQASKEYVVCVFEV